MSALYQTYRPHRFADVAGQKHLVESLRAGIVQGKVVHAYLFHGPRGTGKTTTARIFANRLLCQKAKKNDPEPCMKCVACVAVEHDNASDIVEIDAASHRGIDDIRSLRESAVLRPLVGRYRVYIVDEVHMLTQEAFAALLKTLEEPPGHVVFILATTEFHKVPATIVSRCQVHRFRRASEAELQKRLQWILTQEKRTVAPDALSFIIQRSDGCYRDAESLLGQALTALPKNITREALTDFLGLPPNELVQQFLMALVRGESNPAFVALDALFAGGQDAEQLLRELILEARMGAVQLAQGGKELPPFAREANALTQLPIIIRALVQAVQDLSFVPQPILALQLVAMTVCTKRGEVISQQSQASVPEKKIIVTEAQKPPEVPQKITTDQVKQLWPQVIETMRGVNPVASTFLRAITPLEVRGLTLILQAKYALHYNFFRKREHIELAEKILRELTNEQVTVECVLAAQGQTNNPSDTTLLDTVKEVFGTAVKI